MSICLEKDPRAWEQAPVELWSRRRFVLKMVRTQGARLEKAAARRKADRKVVRAAIRAGSWWALEHAAPELRADPTVVRAAVRKSRWALQYASEHLQRNW